MSKSTVQRILTQARLQPYRLEHYMASNDPDFESKAADIIVDDSAQSRFWTYRLDYVTVLVPQK